MIVKTCPILTTLFSLFHLQSSSSVKNRYESWLSSNGFTLSPFHIKWHTSIFNRLFARCAHLNPRFLYIWYEFCHYCPQISYFECSEDDDAYRELFNLYCCIIQSCQYFVSVILNGRNMDHVNETF